MENTRMDTKLENHYNTEFDSSANVGSRLGVHSRDPVRSAGRTLVRALLVVGTVLASLAVASGLSAGLGAAMTVVVLLAIAAALPPMARWILTGSATHPGRSFVDGRRE